MNRCEMKMGLWWSRWGDIYLSSMRWGMAGWTFGAGALAFLFLSSYSVSGGKEYINIYMLVFTIP